ncbi:MAG: hypothetical protein KDC87_14145 [Planctomycetes bacterium]|nr:hypothetical protein [Planctomycetota bacterium]
MTELQPNLLRIRVPIPAVGESADLRKGSLELRLEHHRGGLCVLVPQPDAEGLPRRNFVGLPRRGALELAVRAPDYRVRVRVLDRLTLAPEGRLRGYVTVPMPHRLLWVRPDGRREPLLEVVPKELKTSWLGEGELGGYVHDTESSFWLSRREVAADTVALIPVVLWNQTLHTITPEELTVSVRERDIREVDGQIVTAPRRLCFGAPERVDERIRALPRKSA